MFLVPVLVPVLARAVGEICTDAMLSAGSAFYEDPRTFRGLVDENSFWM